MDEIRRISNRITVMRDGHRIATHEAGDVAPEQLIREMAGHDLPQRERARATSGGEIALEVKNVKSGPVVRDVSFEVRRGEILGIAGLIGSGRTETLRAIFGADPLDSGEILLDGKTASIRSPSDAVQLGIGLVPEDRKKEGLLLPQSIRVNTTLASLKRHAGLGGWINSGLECETSETFASQLKTRCASPEQAVNELSGGNQQKVVISRWLARDCQVLLFDEPTRGIDAAAKDNIYKLLDDLAAAGKAIVVVSSELTELMLISDRIIVMSAGRIAAEFPAGHWTQEKITEAAFSGYTSR
jgi:ribose transport system ATP-binding protein